METESLINRYRPQTLDEIVGHGSVVRSLKQILKDRTSHAFLFTGIPGIGKTTLARIVAKEVGCEPRNIIEIDGASSTGKDEMEQQVLSRLIYSTLGKNRSRMVIIDEAQNLSKAAITSMLKSVEEPNEFTYWSFCTTDAGKIPQAIKTRCTEYQLNPVSNSDIRALLDNVAYSEKLETTGDVLELIIQKCGGSPRSALSMLAKVGGCTNKTEAAELLQTVLEDNPDVADFCRELGSSQSWSRLIDILKKLNGTSPESIRQIVLSWFTKVAMNSGGDQLNKALDILDAFREPFVNVNSFADVVLAIDAACK